MKHKQPLRRLLPLVLALAAAFALTISASATPTNYSGNYSSGGASFNFSSPASITCDPSVETSTYPAEVTLGNMLKHFVVDHGATISGIFVSSGSHTLDVASAPNAPITVSNGTLIVKGYGNNLTVNGGKVHAYGSFGSITVTDGTLYLDNNGVSEKTVGSTSFTSLTVEDGEVCVSGSISSQITVNGTGNLYLGYTYSSDSAAGYRTAANQETSLASEISLHNSGHVFVNVQKYADTNKIRVMGTSNDDNYPDLTVTQGYVCAYNSFGRVTADDEHAYVLLGYNGAEWTDTNVNEGMVVKNGGKVEVRGKDADLGVTITNTTPSNDTIIDIQDAGSTVTLGNYVTVTGNSGTRANWIGISVASGSKLTMETGSNIVLTNSSTSTDVIGVRNNGGTVQINSAASGSEKPDVPSISLTNGAAPATDSTVSLTGVRNSGGTVTLTGDGTGIKLTNDRSIAATSKALKLTGVDCTSGSVSVSVGSKVTMTNSGNGVSGDPYNKHIAFTGVACSGGTVEISKAVELTNSGYYVTMTGVDASTTGDVTVDNTGAVTLSNSCSDDYYEQVMYGVSHTGSGTTDVKGNVTLTNNASKKVFRMTGVNATSGAVNVTGTVKVTNNGAVASGMQGVNATSGTVNVTGTVTVDNSGATGDVGNLVGAQSFGSATLKVTEAIITVIGKTGGDTMQGVYNNSSSSSVYLTDATVTLTHADTVSYGVCNNAGELVIYARAGLTENASVYKASSAVAPTSASVYVKTDNGTALHLGANSKAAIRGGYGAAEFVVTNEGKALAVSGSVTTADDYAPVITCGTFVDGTGADADSTGNVLTREATPAGLLRDAVNYYVSNVESSSNTYTVTDAVWAIQYYMGENTSDSCETNSAYTASAGVVVFKLPCDVDFSTYDYDMYGALATSAANKTVAVAGERTLDLNGTEITGSDNNIFTDGTTGKALTVINTDSAEGFITAGTGQSAIALFYGDVVVKADAGDITITGKGTEHQTGVATYRGSVGVYTTDDAVVTVDGDVGTGAVGSVTVGTYSTDASTDPAAAVIVTGNVVSSRGDITLVNHGAKDGGTYDGEITVYGYVGTDGNVVIKNGDNAVDAFTGAIYVVGKQTAAGEYANVGVYSTTGSVAVSNVSVYQSNHSAVAVKLTNGVKGAAAGGVGIVNGYPNVNAGSVSVGDITGGAVYVNSYTTNASVTVDLGAIKSSAGKDVNIYSTGKSMLTVYGDVNSDVTPTGDVGVYATDTAAVAILGTVKSSSSGDVLIENASAYSTGDAAIKIAPTIVGNDAVCFDSVGTLTIANNNEDENNATNGKILIVGNGDNSDGVCIDNAGARLKVSNKRGAVIEFNATGSGHGLHISDASVPQSNIYITGSTATYTSVYTEQADGVYTGLFDVAYDWYDAHDPAADPSVLPRTAANYFTDPSVSRAARQTLGDNSPSSVYMVGAAATPRALVVDPTSYTITTGETYSPAVKLHVNGTEVGNAAIVATASSNEAVATVDGKGENPTINKITDGSNVTITYTDAYGSTATFLVNPVATPPIVSGGGGGGAAPAAITVPVSGESKSVAVSATVSGNTATMKAPTEQQLQSVIGASVHTGEVTIDMSGLGSSITTAAIPTETFKAISQAVSATNNDANALTIKIANGSVTFDATALSAIASEATASTVSLNVSKTNVSGLNAAQRAAVQAISSQAVYSITVTSGSKTIATFANGSATISVPYTLTSGQSAEGLVVWYVADDGTMTEIPCTFAGGRVVFTVTHFSNYVIAYDASRVQAQTGCPKDSSCPISAFSDASANAWYHDGVHWALENVIMSGWTTADGAKVFDPNGTTSRAMVAQILWNLEGRPAAAGTASFNDVADNAWYAAAVRWAAGAGIVTGYSDGNGKVFNPDGAVTREQLAAMLYRYAQSKGQGFQGAWAFPLNYPDAASVADWAYEAMCWMTMHGIINGVDGQLAPSASASRAVVATMLQRYTDVAK